MARKSQSIDHLLKSWAYIPGQPVVRRTAGSDGREVLQMRVDMGVLQMETTGRPDGERPGDCETYYDFLVATAFAEGAEFLLNEERCAEVDREFFQFYHRRICWLTLKEYASAAEDAQHTLRLMDFTTPNAPDPSWAMMHEQYRPFVMFHRVQASALVDLERAEPNDAVAVIDAGLDDLERIFQDHDAEDQIDEDVFVAKLREMRQAIIEHYELGPTLVERLAQAIAAEQYELAAQIRDQIDGGQGEGGEARGDD